MTGRQALIPESSWSCTSKRVCLRHELTRISRVDVSSLPGCSFVLRVPESQRSRSYLYFQANYSFLLSFLRPPPGGACLNKKTPSHSQEERDVLLAPGVGFEPTRPEGHRLTGEPIPDMGPRATQTARYQAPEPRLNEKAF